MMTWFDMYNESIKNFEKIAQLQKDYILYLERINYVYNESIKSIETVNHLYDDFARNYEKINRAYEQQFDNMQRMNQKWLDVFSKAWEQKQPKAK
jgi:chromosome segregation ATPase